jgi:hypothetical protein
LLRIAIASALGSVFPRAGAYARASLAGAILDSPKLDGELRSLAAALRSKRHIPWARSGRHGDAGLRATVNGLSAAPEHARRAVVELFDMGTAGRAAATLRRLGLSEIEIGRLCILASIQLPAFHPDQRHPAFSFDIRGLGFLPLLASLIRTRSPAPMITLHPGLLALAERLAAVSRNMPIAANFAAMPRPSPQLVEILGKVAAMSRSLPSAPAREAAAAVDENSKISRQDSQ